MKKKLFIGLSFIAAFIIWTVLLNFVDVKSIGPCESQVGFSTLNGFVHGLTGVNLGLYTVTDWLGLVPIGAALGFAILGLVQLIKRRSLLQVDKSILLLGIFYVAVIAVYVLFEEVPVNYRPTLIDGRLEASYPSSTTLLVTCVMPTAIIELNRLIKNRKIFMTVSTVIAVFTAFTVIGRILSGVHWITDIIGGTLISIGLVSVYNAFSDKISK